MKSAFLRILTAFIFLWVSHEREIHFLFYTHHQVHREEHCSNHLHEAEKHGCELCKSDFSLAPALPSVSFSLSAPEFFSSDFQLPETERYNRNISDLNSRGPPSFFFC